MLKAQSGELFIGTMSGTSIDALDACLACFDGAHPQMLAAATREWSGEERAVLHSLCQRGEDEIERAAAAGILIADAQAELIAELLKKAGVSAQEVTAIGSHGQTIRHRPERGFTVQLNFPSRLAIKTGIDVIADFRQADLCLGGEGAPLTPAFHAGVFGSGKEPCYVLNLGGIANLTVISKDGAVLSGFDTGPANTLMDLCARELLRLPYDEDARCARAGQIDARLLEEMLAHPYFSRLPPKSTGRETFNRDFIGGSLRHAASHPEYVPSLMRTLVELTAVSVTAALRREISRHELQGGTLVLAGGGARNPLLRERLAFFASGLGITLRDCGDFGIDSQYLEALSFAWFAYLFRHALPLELGGATAAADFAVSGSLTPAPHGSFVRRSCACC